MARMIEMVARNRVIRLPKDAPVSARCLVTILEEDLQTLRQQADLTLPEAKQLRMSELLLKNQDGQLSKREEKELDALAAEFDAATLTKGLALGLLAQLNELGGNC